MGDDGETPPGLPVLSAFDKLKLSSSGNNYMTNRNSGCGNSVSAALANRSQASGKVTAASVEASAVAALTSNESAKCEKSISLPPLAQFECGNNKTIVMFGAGEPSCSSGCSSSGASGCGVVGRASGFSSFPTPPTVAIAATSPTPPPPPPLTGNPSVKSDVNSVQIVCGGANDIPVTASTSSSPSLSCLSSSSLSSALSQSQSSVASSPASLASVAMVHPNCVNPGSFSLPAPSSLTVQSKVKKFDANEISMKSFKSGKCTVSVSASQSSSSPSPSPSAAAGPAASPAEAAPVAQLKQPKSAPIICAPPPMVLPNQCQKFANSANGASNKKSNQKAKHQQQNFGFPMLPGRFSSTKLVDTANSKKRQSTPSSSPSLSSVGEKNEQDSEDRNKKKRCSDRYDSSESSDSGVATSLSCTDSNTASSDASDPGSPYSPVLLGDDLHQKSSNMPPQTILATTNGNATKSPTTGAATPVQNVLKGTKQQQKHQNQSQNTPNTAQQQQQQQQQKQGKSQIPAPLQKVSQHLWPWASLNGAGGAGGNFSEMASSPKTNATNAGTKNNNKRHSQVSSTPAEGGAKKTRTTNGSTSDGVTVSGSGLPPPQAVPNNKRLKIAAMEESQTKITGYFKSQMKAQIYQSGLKKDTMSHVLTSCPMSSSSPTVTVTAVVTSTPSPMTSSSVASTTTSTGSSLNKYFNLLSTQLREDQERAANPNPTTTLPSLPPALKKIERSKPTKIAQVAPNLRKTTAAPPLSSQVIEKSPKKHVAIAPRTAETRPRHDQPLPSPMKAPAPPTQQQQQPAVLLTAIRIPQPSQPPQLVPTTPQQQVVSVSKAQQNGASAAAAAVTSKIPTGPSLYQIPMVSNLVQIPSLIAANVSQLPTARGNHHAPPAAQYFLNGTVFKLHQFAAPQAGTNTPTFSIESGNPSINTAAVTTTATAIDASNTKNTSSITATSLQEMLSNQFQTQQQQQQSAHNHRLHHPQPVFMTTTTGLLLNAASLPAMLGSGKQAMAIQSQQIPALQPIQGASAMMPALSSIYSPHQEVNTQQFKPDQVTLDSPSPLQSSHLPPPLSVSSSAFSKLAIVKAGAGFSPTVHQVSATQPPPLVTISSGNQNVIASTKTSANKPSVPAKPYQKKGGPQDSAAKCKKGAADCAKKGLPEPVVPSLVPTLPIVAPPPPPKSPPALAYPLLMTHKEEQKNTEDLFDLLKNSKNETTLTPPSTQFQAVETIKEEPLCSLSTSLPSPETTSNTTIISEDSIKLEETSPADSPNTSSLLESSLTSTSLISSESPKLIIDLKREEPDTTVISETSCTDSATATLSPTVDTTLADSETLPKSAISPILSQPKTIRFPAKHESTYRFGPKGMRPHDGVCHWKECNKKHESSSKLLDHMQTHHVNTQTGPFACLWLGCKVYGRESCSRRWLERHVLSHGGTKPFKCIVDGCGLRFGSQLALQKHVNGHFTATESKDSTNKRTSDPPVPKLLRKNGKKLRYRRQPFSARMFDFFDAGIMEGLQHRLRQISTLTNGRNSITFQGEIMMRRKNLKGVVECFVQWSPPKIISNEWLPESNKPYIKTLPITQMKPHEKINVESLLNSAYRLPYSPNLFQSFHSLSRQSSQDSTASYPDNSQSIASSSSADDATDETSRSSSSVGNPSQSSSVSNLLPLKLPQMELRQKQSRKPPKRIQPS